MVVVLLPSLLATQAGGQARFEVAAATVGEALRGLPVADLLFDDSGELRRLVNVYLDGADTRSLGGLEAPLEGVEEVRVIAAVAGGLLQGGGNLDLAGPDPVFDGLERVDVLLRHV